MTSNKIDLNHCTDINLYYTTISGIGRYHERNIRGDQDDTLIRFT